MFYYHTYNHVTEVCIKVNTFLTENSWYDLLTLGKKSQIRKKNEGGQILINLGNAIPYL